MSFSTVKTNLNTEEANRRSIEAALIVLLEKKKKVEEDIRVDLASGKTEDPADTADLANFISQIATKKGDLATSRTNINTHLSSYESIDPWDTSVIGSFDDNTPILLLPVRTETRFETFIFNGLPVYELWVRIFPDDLEIETHEKALSPSEKVDGQNFYDIYSNNAKTRNEKVNAWNTLCVARGSERSAWIAKYYENNLTDEKFDSWTSQPMTRVMPDKFVVYLYSNYDSSISGNTPDIVSKGKPIPPTLKVGIDPNDADSLDKDANGNIITASEEIEWMFDFQKAIDKGMGLKIPISSAQFNAGFKRLTVLGVKNIADKNEGKTLLEELLESQHMTNGFSILKQGSNTNNTEFKKSAFKSSEFGNEESYKIELEGNTGLQGALYAPTTNFVSKTDGQRLAEALGIDYSYTQNIENADGHDITNAMKMADVVYASTVGYFVMEMLHPVFSPTNVVVSYNPLVETRNFFKDYIRGRGALPSIRIGTQPYGVLPVSSSSISEGTAPINVVDQYYNDMYDLIDTIDTVRRDRVANVVSAGDSNNPQDTMADVLGKHAVSTGYYERKGVGPDFIWNQLSFGNQAADAMAWKTSQDNFASQFQTTTGINFSIIPHNLLVNFRSEQKQVTKPVVSDKRNSETKVLENFAGGNANYIHWIANSDIANLREEDFTNIGVPANTPPPNALVYDYFRQSMLLEYYELACEIGNVPYDDRREKELINMNAETTAQTESPTGPPPLEGNTYQTRDSRWAIFDTTPSGWDETIGQHIDSGMAFSNSDAANVIRVKGYLNDIGVLPTADISLLYAEAIDVCSYRLDSWKLGTHTRRLQKMRIGSGGLAITGLYLGAYGWLEDVRKVSRTVSNETLPPGFPDGSPGHTVETNSKNKGFIHAPSVAQAKTSAVLRAGYDAKATSTNNSTHEINASSERVRQAKYIMQGINNGVSLDALLGYEFERGLHENHAPLVLDKYIKSFRDRFKISSNTNSGNDTDINIKAKLVQSQNVVNGTALIEKYRAVSDILSEIDLTGISTSPAEGVAINSEIDRIDGIMDSLTDLGIAEGVFQLVNNNPDAAGALAEALSGGTNVPQVTVTEDPKDGISVTNKVALSIPPKSESDIDTSGDWENLAITSMAKSEPSLNEWIKAMMPDPKNVKCTLIIDDDIQPDNFTISLEDLNIQPLDWMYLFEDDLKNDESKLSSLVRHKARSGSLKVSSAPHSYAHDVKITIDYSDKGSVITSYSFEELLPLLSNLRETVINSQVFMPSVFKAQGTSIEPNSVNFDFDEFYLRVGFAVNALISIKSDLALALDNTIDYGGIINQLLLSSEFNIEGSIPLCADISDTDYQTILEQQGNKVLKMIINTDKIGILDKIDEYGFTFGITAPPVLDVDYPSEIKKLNEVVELLFGKRFKILPRIEFDTVEKDIWTATKDNHTLDDDFGSNTAEPEKYYLIDEWLAGASRVRPNVANLEFTKALHDTFNDDPGSFNFRTMQFPYDDDGTDRWLGTKVDSTDALKGGRTAILFSDPDNFDPATKKICGIVVDEWAELIPSSVQQTGVAFHYDQPNAKAPQSLLLALPPEFTNQWNWNDLIETVNQTFDEAKKRGLDYTDISDSPIAQFSPMTYSPVSDGIVTIGG